MDELLTRESIDQWMSFFYCKPSPELVPVAIQSMIRHGILKEPTSATSVQAFLTAVFRRYPHDASPWLVEILPITDAEEQEILLTALWLSDTPESKENLEELGSLFHSDLSELRNDYSQNHPPSLLDFSIDDPALIDCLWASFMATGDNRYINHLLDFLQGENSDEDGLVRNAVLWSLESNFREHKKVQEICHQYLANCSEPSEVLTSMMERVAS